MDPGSAAPRSLGAGVDDLPVDALRRIRGTHHPKCQSVVSTTRSMKVRTLADSSREVG
jgi:hypothetical protein